MPELPNPFDTSFEESVRGWNERLDQARLAAAREALLDARTNLALVRKRSDLGPLSRRLAELHFTAALDRAWDAQCMVDPCSK